MINSLKVIVIVLIFGNLSFAQANDGITFQQNLTWQQVLQKAKEENKYIFVDCFATWCAPCREMDQKIFPLHSVGDFFNKNFVCIRLQMDTSAKDNEQIKNLYRDAHTIMADYRVYVYPTYLFFSPEGKLVHRAAGGYNEKGFLSIAKDALDSSKQYFKMFDDYKNGVRDTAAMKKLAGYARMMKDNGLANQIADDFFSKLSYKDLKDTDNLNFLRGFSQGKNARKLIREYVNNLKTSEYFTKENIDFFYTFTSSTKDKSFSILYKNCAKIDKIMGRGDYAESKIQYVLQNEIVDPVIFPNRRASDIEPNWNQLYNNIKSDYNQQYADRVILNSKWQWYSAKKMILLANKYEVIVINKYGKYIDLWYKNNFSWDIFKNSNKKEELEVALGWINVEEARKEKMYNVIDTYANLLYKLGRTNEALKWEQVAVDGNPTDTDVAENLKKMKRGIPTWPAQQ
jgi:thioredoxin-related protein